MIICQEKQQLFDYLSKLLTKMLSSWKCTYPYHYLGKISFAYRYLDEFKFKNLFFSLSI